LRALGTLEQHVGRGPIQHHRPDRRQAAIALRRRLGPDLVHEVVGPVPQDPILCTTDPPRP
jgi:hypothetical protein